MSAVADDGFFAENWKYLLGALALHIFIGVALTVTIRSAATPVAAPQLAIKATLVDHSAARERRERAAAERRAREQAEAEERAKVEAAERQKAEEAAAERKRQDERRAEELKKQAAEQKRKSDTQAAAKAAADRKVADERKRAAEIKAKQAEQQKAAQEAKEQAAREAELKRQLAEEEGRLQAQNSGLLDRYRQQVIQKIERNWNKPDSARKGVVCLVKVRQSASGHVLSSAVGQCNGDAAVRQSIEAAVLSASPLPLPEDMRLFESTIEITLRPE